jgi:hemin uptake protein HemP
MKPAAPATPVLPAPVIRRIHSRELMGSDKQVDIVHGSQCYRLRVTSLGKLILTK